MRITSRRGTIVFFICLGIGLISLAVALNVGWIILNWREGVLLFFGIVFFALLIAVVVVNTIFLVREVRRNEQHDSFINAVTHELKTPVASIRLHLETLQRRELPEAKSTQGILAKPPQCASHGNAAERSCLHVFVRYRRTGCPE